VEKGGSPGEITESQCGFPARGRGSARRDDMFNVKGGVVAWGDHNYIVGREEILL